MQWTVAGRRNSRRCSPPTARSLSRPGAQSAIAVYDAVLHSLHPVDVDTWLGAMPRRVVGPEPAPAWSRGCSTECRCLQAFDSAALAGEDSVLNHYQLAVKVAGTVSCGWFESWLTATKAGDAARAHEAVAAMSTWRNWPMTPIIDHGGWGST